MIESLIQSLPPFFQPLAADVVFALYFLFHFMFWSRCIVGNATWRFGSWNVGFVFKNDNIMSNGRDITLKYPLNLAIV